MAIASKDKIEQLKIGSLDEYIAYIGENYPDDIVLFRGQREDKPLLPKIARIHTNSGVRQLRLRGRS
jgi:hypothetical protein